MEIKVFTILYSNYNGTVEAEHRAQQWIQIIVQGAIVEGVEIQDRSIIKGWHEYFGRRMLEIISIPL